MKSRRKFIQHSSGTAVGVALGLELFQGGEALFAETSTGTLKVRLKSVTADDPVANKPPLSFDEASGLPFYGGDEKYMALVWLAHKNNETTMPASYSTITLATSQSFTVYGSGKGQYWKKEDGEFPENPTTQIDGDQGDVKFDVEIANGELAVTVTDNGGDHDELGLDYDMNVTSSVAAGGQTATVEVTATAVYYVPDSTNKATVTTKVTFEFEVVCD